MYRDHVEAGRHRIAALEIELAEARRWLEERPRSLAAKVGPEWIPPEASTDESEESSGEPLLHNWPYWLLAIVLLGGGGIGYAYSQVHTWPAVYREGKVVAASPGAPAKVGDTCFFEVEPSEANDQFFSRSRNCHVRLACGGQRNDEGEMVYTAKGHLYGGTLMSNEGFMPCLVVDEKPVRGADTMKSSVDKDPALTFDVPARDVVLTDDDYLLRIALQ